MQLAVQEAKAWSRVGRKPEADAALRHAATALARLPMPEHPEHHFVFDPPKLSFYAATCYVWLGEADQAEEHAIEVVQHCEDRTAPSPWPMRFAEASVDLGLVAVQRGELERASQLGTRALELERKSASALGRFAELDRALHDQGPGNPEVQQFHERLTQTQEELSRDATTTLE